MGLSDKDLNSVSYLSKIVTQNKLKKPSAPVVKQPEVENKPAMKGFVNTGNLDQLIVALRYAHDNKLMLRGLYNGRVRLIYPYEWKELSSGLFYAYCSRSENEQDVKVRRQPDGSKIAVMVPHRPTNLFYANRFGWLEFTDILAESGQFRQLLLDGGGGF